MFGTQGIFQCQKVLQLPCRQYMKPQLPTSLRAGWLDNEALVLQEEDIGKTQGTTEVSRNSKSQKVQMPRYLGALGFKLDSRVQMWLLNPKSFAIMYLDPLGITKKSSLPWALEDALATTQIPNPKAVYSQQARPVGPIQN